MTENVSYVYLNDQITSACRSFPNDCGDGEDRITKCLDIIREFKAKPDKNKQLVIFNVKDYKNP